MKGKRLYTGFSLSRFIWLAFLRAALAFTMVYFLSHYNDNPILLSILAAICFIFILVIGDDKIIVFEDKILQADHSFISLAFGWGDKSYMLADIKQARLKPLSTRDVVDDTVAILLAFVLPKQPSKSSNLSPIFLDFKTGEKKVIYTDLSTDEVKRIVEIVNELLRRGN
jgi:hypothetical protein